ncbi:hypothetical protein BC829DRAFT_40675 [Chytridium lagenaria]|nr:hypothetical protein BC829DRAFT_40675 [Chytridium lagenaria]
MEQMEAKDDPSEPQDLTAESRRRFRYKCWYLSYAVDALVSLDSILTVLAPMLTSGDNFSEEDIDFEDEAHHLRDNLVDLRAILDVKSKFHFNFSLEALQDAIEKVDEFDKQVVDLSLRMKKAKAPKSAWVAAQLKNTAALTIANAKAAADAALKISPEEDGEINAVTKEIEDDRDFKLVKPRKKSGCF